MDAKQAAEYLVVAWCRGWTMRRYAQVLLNKYESQYIDANEVEKLSASFQWIANDMTPFLLDQTVRAYVCDQFPRLSEWLLGRGSDIARLACTGQIERLRGRKGRVKTSDADRREAGRQRTEAARASQVRRMQIASGRTHARSAWNVCKA